MDQLKTSLTVQTLCQLMGVVCDRLRLGSTTALGCRTGQNKSRYCKKELSFLHILLIELKRIRANLLYIPLDYAKPLNTVAKRQHSAVEDVNFFVCRIDTNCKNKFTFKGLLNPVDFTFVEFQKILEILIRLNNHW